jgi:hypothetical protein
MTSAFDFLRSSQDTSGGWGYFPGHYPTTEATAAVLLAIRDDPGVVDLAQSGLGWLRNTQHEDGGWGYAADDEESGWLTAWAVLAFNRLRIFDQAYRRGVEWLINVKPLGYRGDDFSNLDQPNQANEAILYSWPWYPGEATWVEPTSLAILALTGEVNNQPAVARVRHGLDYLTQRRCPKGGWNVGNPVMFDSALLGHAPQTALALMALQAEGIGYEDRDIEALRLDLNKDGGPLAIGLACLAMQVFGINADDLANRLASMQKENGSWSNNCYHTAVALMAERGSL